jgi:hypothetical protein
VANKSLINHSSWQFIIDKSLNMMNFLLINHFTWVITMGIFPNIGIFPKKEIDGASSYVPECV